MVKKIILIFVSLFIVSASVLAPVVKAQESWYGSSYATWNDKVFKSPDGEIFGERYTFAQIQWIIFSIRAMLDGSNVKEVSCFSGGHMEECFSNLTASFDEYNKYAEENPNNSLSMLGAMTKSPISGIGYIKSIGQRLKLVPEVKAQGEGFGFNSLNPILSLWKAVRNITYVFFIIFIIASAFMIMFRVKLNPQTVISVQSALPKIIVALVLVTFSYAIAGLLIDLMYVVFGILATMLKTGSGNIFETSTDWTSLFEYLTEGPFHLGSLGYITTYTILFYIAYAWVYTQILLSSVAGAITGVLMIVLLPIIWIVVFIVLIISFIKILWMLFKTFAMIILLVIVSPIVIAMGAISQAVGFGTWLKAILSQLVVFPVTSLMLTLAIFFVNGAIFSLGNEIWPESIQFIEEQLHNIFFEVDLNITALGGDLWAPPLTAGTKMYSLLYLGLSFVLVVLTPKIADMIKSMMQGRPFDYGTAIGEPIQMIKDTSSYRAYKDQAGLRTARAVLDSGVARKVEKILPFGLGSSRGDIVKGFDKRIEQGEE